MVRRFVALFVTALLAAALLGMPGTPGVASAGAAEPAPPIYVALGDSFAAGPLIPVQEVTGCLRSTNNYAKLVAPRLGFTLRDVTCSGAQTKHMTEWQGVSPEKQFNGKGVPPQFSALSADVDLVTLQIGGNDIGFSGIIDACMAAAQNRIDGSGPTSCRDQYVKGGVDELRNRIAVAASRVAAVVAGIKARAPQADVVLLGYSGIFAFGQTASCPAMLVGEEDAQYLRGVQETLNAMIATQAASGGARYVDVYRPSAGHTACDAPAIRWVEPIVPVNAAAPVHPNLTGMIAVAGIVEEAVTRQQAIEASLDCDTANAAANKPWVLLVHGTGVTAAENWSWGYAPDLAKRGYGVCTVQLPERALNDIQVSAEYVVHAIKTMHADPRNGGRKISVIGHSQGGLVPRWALRWWPELRPMVDDLVTLGTPHQGTTVAQSTVQGYTCEACHQMQGDNQPGSAGDSDFIAALNSWDETPGDVSYTSIYTEFDELVRPQTNAELRPAGAGIANVSNIKVQDLGGFCSWRTVDHLGLAGDAVAHALVLDALSNAGPAVRTRVSPAVCAQGSFATDLAGQTAWSSGAFHDQWLNDGTGPGGLALGARYGTAEPALAHYVRGTRLTLSAPTTATATDVVTVSATLTDVGGQPLAGRSVSFTLGSSSASATTSSSGVATANLVVDHDAGPASVVATFAGDATHAPAGDATDLTVVHDGAALVYVGQTAGRGDTVTVAATLADEDSALGLAGRTIRFAVGAVTALAVTDATGTATATITVPDHGKTQQVTATFDGDPRYRAAATSAVITWGGPKA